MANVADGDIFSVIQEYRHDLQQVLFTMHYRLDLQGDPPQSVVATCGFLADQVNNPGGLNDVLAACYSSDGISGRVLVQDIWPIRYAYVEVDAANAAGAIAVVSLPPNVAHALVVRGELATRHDRGTKHVGIAPDTFSLNGLITAAGLAALDALGSSVKQVLSLGAAYPTATMTPIMFSKSAPGASEAIKTWTTPATTRVMRRRTVGRGS